MTAIPALTPAEFAIMKALWRAGDATVADVRAVLAESGSEAAYTTVMTLLGRMVQKGAVTVDRSREPFVYAAAVRKQHVARQRLREFLRDVFDNDAETLVLGLVEDAALSVDELRHLEGRLDALREAERKGKPKP
ncbi:MAG TPA: BlaI/MecI/CopY family transcriptional regulator [Kofleriaceae bacterium]|nr:BlaI/MecI/CopY family transcriptional regulator [Kofleriaceae bacterium]